ncbi:MAG TPA: dihydropteroate synthase [Candidatus Ruminococcus avistercoris]|nr:dihydropteroate synthase [Candidatus Ruminococcus avistercoris]
MKIGNREFDFSRHTYIMGILNVTPDSFSDGGKWNDMDRALRHVEEMIREGADVIDVGGESTRPGHQKISDEEETQRVAPVIEALKKRFDVPVSVDTYKSSVAAVAIEAGVDLLNDIWGFRYDSKMAALAAASQVACCLMHNKDEAVYRDFMKDMMEETLECARIALQAGVAKDRILLDPGIGFGKTYEMNLEALRRLDEFCSLGYPVLLGTSRKSVIGLTLDLPADQRLEGTLVTTVLAVQTGCAFVRVHDIRENRRAIQMMEAIQGKQIRERMYG